MVAASTRLTTRVRRSCPPRGRRGCDVADQPGELAYVWSRVIADLSGTSAGSAAALSAQQRAFLRLTRPLGLIDGTALLAAPSEFAKDAIERILRRPISDALGRHLGFAVNLAVVVDVDAASGGTEVPDPPGTVRPQPAPAPAPPGFSEPDGAMFPATRPEPTADEELLVPAGGPPVDGPDDARASGNGTWSAYPPAPTPPRGGDTVPSPSQSRLNEKYIFDTFVIGASNRFATPRPSPSPRRPRRPTTRCSSRATPGWARRTCCTPSGTTPSSLYPGMRVRYVAPRGVHQRLHQLPARRQGDAFQRALPRHGHPAGRRHPVPGEQGVDPGGVLPHLQHAPQREQADRALLRPAAQAAGHPRGPAAQPLRVGPDHRRPAARAGDPHRDPAQEGRPGPAGRAAGRPGVHRRADPAQHPRAGGRADPGHGVRLAEPAARRHPARRDRAAATSSPTPPPRRSPRRRSWRSTADFFGVSIEDLCGPGQTKALAQARQIAMYLCRELTDLSLPRIGRVRRPRPHHGDARRQEDPQRDRPAPQDLRQQVRSSRTGSSSARPARRRAAERCGHHGAPRPEAGPATVRGRLRADTIFHSPHDTQPLVVRPPTFTAPTPAR